MPDIWHIYTLSDNGNVFYVGISKDVSKRYRYHIGCNDLCTCNIIYWIRRDGRLPTLELLNTARSQKEAEIAETAVIRQLYTMGNKLSNVDINPQQNRIITCSPYPSHERLKRVNPREVKEQIRQAKDRFYKLIFSYSHDQKDRLQYMGYTANVSG